MHAGSRISLTSNTHAPPPTCALLLRQVVVAVARQERLQRQLRLLVQPRQLICLLVLQAGERRQKSSNCGECGALRVLAGANRRTPAAQTCPPHLNVAPLCRRQRLLLLNRRLVVGVIVLAGAVLLLCSPHRAHEHVALQGAS